MSSELKYWYLSDHKLFRNLSHSEVDTLCILKKFKKTSKLDIVELPYSEKARVYFLKKGTLKLIELDENGDEIVKEILHKGDLFGELDFNEERTQKQEFFKVVSEEAIICTFFKQNLEDLMSKKPDFAINYIKFMGWNFKKMKNQYNNLFFKDAKTRLLLLIQSILEKEEVTSNTYTLTNYLTQKDFAQLICTSRQTIVMLFNDLEKDGLLSYTQKQIRIHDIQTLNKLITEVN